MTYPLATMLLACAAIFLIVLSAILGNDKAVKYNRLPPEERQAWLDSERRWDGVRFCNLGILVCALAILVLTVL